MTIAGLIAALRRRDVRLWLEHGRPRYSAPSGALDAELRAELIARKDEIVAFLRAAEALRSGPPAIVPLKPEGSRPPLFAIPGHNGDVFCYMALARHLDADQPLLGVQPPGVDSGEPVRSVEELARYEVGQIRQYRPRGPYLIAGYCAGGTIAFEIARQLAESGEHVALLALIGSPFPALYRWTARARLRIEDLTERGLRHLKVVATSSVPVALAYVKAALQRRCEQRTAGDRDGHDPMRASSRNVAETTIAAIRRYRVRPYPGQIDLFMPSEAWRRYGGLPGQWRTVAGAVREAVGPDGSSLDEMLKEPYVQTIAAVLRSYIAEIAPQGGITLG